MSSPETRQIIYRSTACGTVDADLILEQSRHNNAIDGVTGVLWFNGTTFIQVLEGPSLSVTETFTRIARDTRHEAVVIVSDRLIAAPEFGYWSMERQSFSGNDDGALAKLKRKLSELPADVQDQVLEATR